MEKNKIIDFLDDQFWKHKVFECMPEADYGYETVPRDGLSKIVDGLIPMIKSHKADYWKTRCELAEKYIEESPCDPDIYNDQQEAYKKWMEFKTKDQ